MRVNRTSLASKNTVLFEPVVRPQTFRVSASPLFPQYISECLQKRMLEKAYSNLQKVILGFGILSRHFFPLNCSFSKVLVEDLFGEAAKEREVEKIANKLPEAKTCKSFDTYEILAKFAGTRSLTGLVSPLKEVGL